MSQDSCATPEGTARYAERLGADAAPGHFRRRHGLHVSSIGLGTASGKADEQTDELYRRAVARAFKLGVNVIDSSINYRYQRSERAIGAALAQLFKSGAARRDEVLVATKAGGFTFDEDPLRPAVHWVAENVIAKGLARPEEIVGGGHCISPPYLEDQLSRSLANLGLDCIDIYYLHNPETQLEAVPREDFNKRMCAAFELFERVAADGRIQFYGTATWNGYRRSPGEHGYLSLTEMVSLAREVGGESHRFRVIQLPLNLAKPEAITLPNQTVDGEVMSLLSAAALLDITVMCSAPIGQGRLARDLPPVVAELFGELSADAQRAIQFVRSTQGVTTALVGMSDPTHVEENLSVVKVPPVSLEDSFGTQDERRDAAT
jgi:aryl-alcohol dehydrogenase-like predicted oxidoreductase